MQLKDWNGLCLVMKQYLVINRQQAESWEVDNVLLLQVFFFFPSFVSFWIRILLRYLFILILFMWLQFNYVEFEPSGGWCFLVDIPVAMVCHSLSVLGLWCFVLVDDFSDKGFFVLGQFMSLLVAFDTLILYFAMPSYDTSWDTTWNIYPTYIINWCAI